MLSRLFLASAGLVIAQASNPVAYTKNGYVQGFVQDGVNVFNSLPFAAAPTGELRFRAPQVPDSWNGTKDVSNLPPICPQLKLDGDIALSEDEDCLYLVCRAMASAVHRADFRFSLQHVYAPETASTDEPLPVMFWIFGGGWALVRDKLCLLCCLASTRRCSGRFV